MLLRALAYERKENVKNISKVVSFWVQTFVKHDNFNGIFKRRNSIATCGEFCFKNAVCETRRWTELCTGFEDPSWEISLHNEPNNCNTILCSVTENLIQ
jgi:hypothetical protein